MYPELTNLSGDKHGQCDGRVDVKDRLILVWSMVRSPYGLAQPIMTRNITPKNSAKVALYTFRSLRSRSVV